MEELLSPDRRRVLLITGPLLVIDWGTSLATRVLLRGLKVLYLDGANAFDPYILSRLARRVGQEPGAILRRLLISRAFTCHQLETLVGERLEAAMIEEKPALVVISGWSSLFLDENVPLREALRLLQNTAATVRRLALRIPFLATHVEDPATPRLPLLRAHLVRAADVVIRVRDEEGQIVLQREKPPGPVPPWPVTLEQEKFLPLLGK